MGFGLLFIGYFFLLSLPYNGIDMLPDVIGFLIMFIALRRLVFYCRDNRGFLFAKFTLLPAAILSLAILVISIVKLNIQIPEGVAMLQTILQVAYAIAIGAYEVFLLLGIYKLARSVELPRLASRAQHMLTLTAVYYLAQLLISTGWLHLLIKNIDTSNVMSNYLSFAVYLLGYVWMICSLALIFSCYMRICLEGDEDMPYREDLFDKLLSRFKGSK